MCHNGTCFCAAGFAGPACAGVKCDNDCWQRGVCLPDGTCACDTYWSFDGAGEYQRCNPENYLAAGNCRDSPARFDARSNCSIAACRDDCSGHGVCTATGCVCDIGWAGASCALLPCPFDCRSHGVCNNGTCACRPGFVGASCEWPPPTPPPPPPPGAAAACPPARPFFCGDAGACLASLGECAARRAKQTGGVWAAEPYGVLPLTARAGASASASSNAAGALSVIDGNDGAGGFWQSGQCYPLGYVQNPLSNILLGACLAGRCQGGAPSDPSPAAATDGDLSTSADVPVAAAGGGGARITFGLSPPAALAAVSLLLVVPDVGVSVVGVTAGAAQRVPLGTVTASRSQVNPHLSL